MSSDNKMSGDEEGVSLSERKSAFECRISSYELKNNEHVKLDDFFRDAFTIFEVETQELLNEFHIMKLNTCFEAKFIKPAKEKDESESWEYITMYIQTPNRVIDGSKNILQFYTRNITSKITTQISEMSGENGSGWTLHEIVALVVNNNKHQSFNGASYIPLPVFFANKKAIINVKNSDNQCFKWAVLAALHPEVKVANRVSSYVEFENELNFNNMTFPVTLNQLEIFERQNQTIAINVYAIDDEYNHNTRKREQIIVPIRITDYVKRKRIHLLWICSDDCLNKNHCEEDLNAENELNPSINELANEMDIISHYCYIKNLSKLVVSQCNSHNSKIWLCDRCLHYFYSEIKLQKHVLECEEKNKCKITLPQKSSMQRWVSFNNHKRQLPVPFIVYADVESLLQPIAQQAEIGGKEMPKGAYQKHIPSSVGYYLHDLYHADKSKYKYYTGADCINWFVDELYEISMQVASQIRYVTKMDLSCHEKELYHKATICHICGKTFDGLDTKVRDHSHITGAFRGAAHNECNLKYQEARLLPVVFHNLNYDSHFLIEILSSAFSGKIDIIPINNEHYISFTKEVDDSIVHCEQTDKFYNQKMKIRFIDSYRFLPSSLQKLASYLPRDRLIITNKEWSHLTPEKFNLLCKKGTYPYDYMDSSEKLNETQLPPKDMFYNKLNDQHISDEEYSHAQRVWEAFEIENMLDYTNIYLKTDVLLLADIFENFRMSSINLYGLDPAHYYTTPGLSWDAMLKHTKVRLEVLTDIDMLLFVEKGSFLVDINYLHITYFEKTLPFFFFIIIRFAWRCKSMLTTLL